LRTAALLAPALALLALVVAVVGLAVGVKPVDRSVETWFFTLAALAAFVGILMSLPGLVWQPPPPGMSARQALRMPVRPRSAAFARAGSRAALATGLVGLALALVVAGVRAREKPVKGPVVQVLQTEVGVTLTQVQRQEIEREAKRLEKSNPVAAGALSLIGGAAGAIGANVLTRGMRLAEAAGPVAAGALNLLSKLRSQAGTRISVKTGDTSITPTLKLDHPQFSLGGVKLTFQRSKPGPPPPAQNVLKLDRPSLSVSLFGGEGRESEAEDRKPRDKPGDDLPRTP
jgi:hypothetical protein